VTGEGARLGSSRVSFHVGILPDRSVAEIADLVAEIEALGFDGVWIADSQSIMRDGYAALTLSAARTSRIVLATGVTNPVTRHPAVIAGAIATIDELSGGRAVLGIGVGESAVATVGLPKASLASLEEVTGVLRALLRGETASYDGRDIRLAWPTREVPVVFASSGPRSLELAGRIADGVLFQVGSTPAAVQYALDHIALGAERRRLPERPQLLIRLGCCLADDRGWAREQIRGYAAVAATAFPAVPRELMPDEFWADLDAFRTEYDSYQHGRTSAPHATALSERLIDTLTIAGTPAEAVPRFRELIALGVDGFVLPVTGEALRPTIRAFAEHVLPELVW
jgi:5,10-methylenetetrahydromethanopterin reductase